MEIWIYWPFQKLKLKAYSPRNCEICLNESKKWRKAETSISTFRFLFAVASRVFIVEQFKIWRWKANGKTNLMISKHLKVESLQPEKSWNMFEHIQKWRKAACVLYSTYSVTPISCYLLHAASLVRFRNWSLPSTLLKSQGMLWGR